MTSVYIHTYGCSQNQADSEIMAGLLHKAGFRLVESIRDAQLVIINTCTVKAPTEKKFFDFLERLQEHHKYVVVAGCLPQSTPSKLAGYSMIGTTQLDHIVEVVEETLNGNVVTMLVPQHTDKLQLPRIRRNSIIEIVPLSNGCMGDCAYCIVKHARGRLQSYPVESILRRVRRAVAQGAREIWLTSQDTGCYGKDIGTSVTQLLQQLAGIPGDFYIRLGMMNPNFALEHCDELIECFESDRLFRFLHIPVQAGCDEVLERMQRPYTVEQFESLIARIRSRFPDMTISTDVICGFPGETKEQFQQTVELIKRVQPDVLNISRYWDRPGTEASRMSEKVHPNETKERSRYLNQVFEWVAYKNNKRWLHWEGPVVVDEYGKNETSIARNYAYKQVILPGNYPLGSRVRTRITSVTMHDLRGKQN